jgi:WD40 repeat protein
MARLGYSTLPHGSRSPIGQWTVTPGHPGRAVKLEVYSLTLFPNDRLLASTSLDKTARLWNLDTNRQVGPPLQHDNYVYCLAFSVDGKLLTTGTGGRHRPYNAYVWDIYAILKAAGLEDLLSDVSKSLSNVRCSLFRPRN